MISVKLKCVCLIWYMGIAAVTQGQSVSDFPTSKKCVNPREQSNEENSWQSLKSFENSLRSENDLISSSESSNAHSLMIALNKRIPSQEKPISRLRLGKLPHKRPKTAQTCKTALSLPLRTQQPMLIEIPDQTNQHLSKNTHGAFNEPMKYDIPLKGSQGFESDDKKAQRSESSSTGANEIPTVEEPPKRLHRRWEATPKTNFDRTTVGNYFLELCSEKKAEGDVIHTVVNTPHSRDVDRSEVGPECDLKAWNPEVHPDQNSFKIPITNYGICQTIDPQNSYEDVRKCGTPFQNLLNSQKENIPSHTPLSDTVGRVFAPRDIGMESQPFTFNKQTFCDSILKLEGTDPLEGPTLKLQRSSQFIPICPEVHNITEIYWELCKDCVSDDEFFEELKKQNWTEDILKLQGFSQNPTFQSRDPISTSSREPLWHRPSEAVKPLPHEAWQPSSVVTYPVGNEIKPFSHGWSQLPTSVSAQDVTDLNNYFIPLESRTYPPGSCVPANPNNINININNNNNNNNPRQEVKPFPVRSMCQPAKGFDHARGDLDNTINRQLATTPEVIIPSAIRMPKIKTMTSNFSPDAYTSEKQNVCEKHEKGGKISPEEEPVIGVEFFSAFNQVMKTKILQAQKVERDGDIILLPKTRSQEGKGGKEELREVEVHVTTFNCTKRDTPENLRMEKVNLKELHKGETWPHLTYLKLIPLSKSFDQEPLQRDKSEEVAELLKTSITADIKPINQTEAGE